MILSRKGDETGKQKRRQRGREGRDEDEDENKRLKRLTRNAENMQVLLSNTYVIGSVGSEMYNNMSSAHSDIFCSSSTPNNAHIWIHSRTNSSGESGQPWLVPQPRGNI